MSQLSAHANSTGPGAGVTIATLSVPVGVYEVSVTAWLSGTVTAAELDNVALQSDPVTVNTFVTAMVPPLVNFAATVAAFPVAYRAIVDAQSVIKVIAVAAAGASAIYHVTLVANSAGESAIGTL